MPKRIAALCLTVLLLLSAVPQMVFAEYSLPQFVRIGLMYGNGAPKTIQVESEHGFLLGNYNQREFTERIQTAETSLTVSITDGTIQVCDAKGTLLDSATGSIGIKPNASGKDQKLRIDGVEYRGALDCIPDGTVMTVVNVVFLDHYLYGVISREMSPSWHIEALKAQAVCARNYVAVHLNKHGSAGFDLCNNVHCQAYSGTRVETKGSYAPVDETTRQVLTYGGKLAELYYSSSMGPTTEDVKHVWGNSVPYLISVDNSYEDTENIPNGVWSDTLTVEEATTIMRNKGYDVGDVTEIKVLEYTPNGRVLKMEVKGTKSKKTFERESCRTLFNTVTKSQMFSVTPVKEGETEQAVLYLTDGTKTGEASDLKKLTILTASGRKTLSGSTLYASDGKTQASYAAVKKTAQTTGFRFDGTGWGHSVGMSQYGAKGMAEAGHSYVEIVLHYFPGTNLENVY